MNRRDFFLTANTATRLFGFYDGGHQAGGMKTWVEVL